MKKRTDENTLAKTNTTPVAPFRDLFLGLAGLGTPQKLQNSFRVFPTVDRSGLLLKQPRLL